MAASRLAVSIGCPCGIGPEVSVEAAARAPGPVLLVGDRGVLLRAAHLRGVAEQRLVAVEEPARAWQLDAGQIGVLQPTRGLAPEDSQPGAPTAGAGAAQLAWVDATCDLVASGAADAMITGPVSKEVIVRSGAPGSTDFLGHTEHLQRRLRAQEVVMAFWAERLTTALVTTHVPLARVPAAITPAAVERTTFWLAALLAALGGSKKELALAVAALNPHAGEGGLLGTEEQTAIAPGLDRARAMLAAAGVRAQVVGPVAAETAFRLALSGRFDGVVAMYHDQATIPMKIVGFGDAVNVSLGLPLVRTSVDHGTGYDVAGKNLASAHGMSQALALAARLTAATATSLTMLVRSRRCRAS